MEASKFQVKFGLRAGKIKLVDFLAKIDLTRKKTPEPFKCHQSSCKFKMKGGKFFNCSQLPIDFGAHSLLSAWKEVDSDLRLFIDSTTILDLFHAKTAEKTPNI